MSTSTVLGLVVIVSLIVYIVYLQVKQPAKDKTNRTLDDEREQPTVPIRTKPKPVRQSTRSVAPVAEEDDPNDAQIVTTVPNVTTNIYQATHYEDPMTRPPLRRYTSTYNVPVAAVPINIQTRGPTPEVQQVGVLTSADNDKILALYGRPTYRGSSKWLYYTGTDKYQSIKLPVEHSGRNCTDEFGCDELMEDDTVSVKGYGGTFKASIYNLDAPRYIPFVV